ncbi:MAG: N-formylglutamate amidohydrolase [Gemmobacter sp.]|nr:N-formylglutamate amidohydrolase [Gemmobacter sp.]
METETYSLSLPECQTAPVVFSSPHSGRDYTAGFMAQVRLDSRTIRSSEDAFVDELIGSATAEGIPLLAARVPRACLDLNRSSDELDPAVIEGIKRAPHNPRVSSGLGVIPRVVALGRPIYHGKIPLTEAEARLRRHWHPYHGALREMIEATHRQFGRAVLIDWHSMPHDAIAAHGYPGELHPEVVLGDRFGAAAGRDVMERIETAFRAAGLRVARNTPFAGAYIAQAYGRPSARRHVVQIEIDRALYMDETRIDRHADFDAFQHLMTGIVAGLAAEFREDTALAAE